MATQKVFQTHRIVKEERVKPGTGVITIPVTFVPDYISPRFLDQQHTPEKDTLTFDLASTGLPAQPYTLTVSYSVHASREIRVVVAKLPRDPELTIAFGN